MNLGINCRYNDLLKKEVIANLKQENIKFVEIRKLPREINHEELEFIKNKFGYSIHASFEDLKIRLFPKLHYSKKGIKEVERDIDFAVALNVKELVIHGGAFFRGYIRLSKIIKRNIGLNIFLDLFIKTFGPMLKRADEKGIKIVMENCYPCFLFGRSSDIIYLKERLPFLGFCLDLAHSEIYNQTDDFMKLNIDHIHITDNNKKSDQHLKIGDGSINFKEFFGKFKDKNYNKKIIVECEELRDSIDSINRLKILKAF